MAVAGQETVKSRNDARRLRHTGVGVRALGVAALGSLALFATAAALLDANRSRLVVTAFLSAGVASMLLVTVLGVLSLRSTGARSPQLEFFAAAEQRLGDWLYFLAGCLLALPAASLYLRVLPADNDSARLLASILHVQREGIGHLVNSQEVLLPHLILGPFVSLGGLSALQAVDVLSVVALTGVVSFLSWRLTNSPVGAVAAALALTALPQVIQRAVLVPMYPAMLAFGFLGVYLAYRAMTATRTRDRWRAAALAAVCLILSMEAHQFGQFFVVLSALLLVAVPSRSAAAGLGRVYACLAVLYIPRAIVNLSDGGFSHFFSNRVDYWTTEGYLATIQVDVLNYPGDLSLGTYLRRLAHEIPNIWGTTGLLTLGLAVASVLFSSSRLRRFTAVCALLLLCVIVYRRLPFFPRYFSLLLVGSSLAAGVTVAALARKGSLPWRAAAGAAVFGLLVLNVINYHDTLDRLQRVGKPYGTLAAPIRPGDGVIGTRSFHLDDSSTNPSTYGTQFLTESEYRTFLTWPSDDEVIELMRRHDVRWVFVPDHPDRWVVRYNDPWLGPRYGEHARYHLEVRRSPNFCLVRRAQGGELYRLELGNQSPSGRMSTRCAA